MKARLSRAPRELTAAARSHPLVLSLPSPAGGFVRFAVQESPVVAPKLAARYPFIKTYSGQGIDDPAATIRFDLGRTGFHAQVLSPNGDWYIDPLDHLDQSAYVSYFARDLSNGHGRFVEHGVRSSLHPAPLSAPVDADRVVGTELRTYRLALAADGEYSQFQGGTVPLVHNELVVAVNRVTGVYERELSIRLQLVANNDSLIYLNPATDPYTNTNPSQLLTQNQATIDSVIGNANYDIGHVFSTGGGGLAGLAVVGRTGQKARGETGLGSPVGDAFYIDYVAHEMGHQFGGNHSFNGTQGSCAGNGNASTAMEPGSGTTIMAYAGICGADDLQLHSDDYFHAISFDEIAAYTTTPGSPGNLGAAPTGNAAPTVSVNGGPFTIPIRTPFALSATGADANGDALSYTWEQYDGGALRTLNNASKPTGVLFRSFAPVTTPTRVFPKMSSVLANSTDANSGTCPALPGGLDCWGEFLPAVARTMNFRVTVRDNRAGGGGVNSANVVVTAAGTAPFLVTSPNTAVSLPGGSSQTITWNVAGTNAAPVGTTNVNITLSTDGGATFPTTLLANTPNDGSQSVSLPSLSTTQARIKIEAVGNIFFDVSDASFTITSGGGNVAPVANDDAAATAVNTPVQVAVLANDTDSDGTVDPTSVTVVTPPVHGSAVVNPTTGIVTYSPSAAYTGPDAFTYTVEDDDGATSNIATVSITVTGGGGGSTFFPSSVTALNGSIASGSAASLAADDDGYLVVNSSTGKGAKVAAWYGSFTGVDNAVTSLGATYTGKASLTCSQTISIWRWTDSTWVQLDARSIGTTEVQVADLTPSGSLADFVSGATGTGEVRVRISCSTSAAFTASGDLLRIQAVTGGGGGSTFFPSSVTALNGSIASGSAASLAADDDGYLVVNSSTGKGAKVAAWYGSFTGVDNAVTSLGATYTGKASLTCSQTISIWRWTDSTWVQLDARSIGTTEVQVADLTPSGSLADFVSGATGTGEVRVRISCSTSAAFTASGICCGSSPSASPGGGSVGWRVRRAITGR